jgi:hypothetical protein
MSGSMWQGMETSLPWPRRHSLTLPADDWESARFLSFFLNYGSFPFPSPVLTSRRYRLLHLSSAEIKLL